MDRDSRTVVDDLSEKVAERMARTSTRRSFLGQASRILFGILGIQLLPARPVIANGADPAWDACGAYGSLCKTDCGGASDNTCITGCMVGPTAWAACCTDPANGSVTIKYYDCFKVSGAKPPCTKTEASKGLACITTDAPKPTYGLPSGSVYCCSIIRNTGVVCTP